jgi:hypothetical protein
VSRFSLDPPDDDAYDVRDDGTACEDCGRPSVAWLCETCSDQRDAHTSALQVRMAGVVEVQLVPVSTISTGPVVEVALVPIQTGVNPKPIASVHVLSATDARDLKRMARAFLSADLTNVKDVA